MKLTVLLAVLLAFASCASKKEVEKEVQEKAAQSSVSNSQALGGTIHELISSSKTLTDAQKAELTKILDANKKKAEELSEQSFKFRGVLIQELLGGEASQQKIKILKKDIKKVEEARLKNTFDTVEKISAIVSKHPDNEKYEAHLINIERSFR